VAVFSIIFRLPFNHIRMSLNFFHGSPLLLFLCIFRHPVIVWVGVTVAVKYLTL
jgi:hypothetical protein